LVKYHWKGYNINLFYKDLHGKIIKIPNWANNYLHFARDLQLPQKKLYKILIISPFREYIIPLIAFGMVKYFISHNKSDPQNDDEYYDFLSKFPKNSLIRYTDQGRVSAGILLSTDIHENGQKGIVIKISNDSTKITLFKNFSNISIADNQEDIHLKKKYSYKGQKVYYERKFLSGLLDKPKMDYLFNSNKSEIIIIGNKKQLQDEIQTQHFQSYNLNQYETGSLNAMIRTKGILGADNNYISELFSNTLPKIEINCKNSTIFFDGANAFIRHSDNFIDNNNILLISKNDPSINDAIIKFNELLYYCGEIEKENYGIQIQQFPKGTEIYSAIIK